MRLLSFALFGNKMYHFTVWMSERSVALPTYWLERNHPFYSVDDQEGAEGWRKVQESCIDAHLDANLARGIKFAVGPNCTFQFQRSRNFEVRRDGGCFGEETAPLWISETRKASMPLFFNAAARGYVNDKTQPCGGSIPRSDNECKCSSARVIAR